MSTVRRGPPFSGGGIVVAGASYARLTANHATGDQPSGDTIVSGGIVVISSVCFGGSDPTHIQVHHNTLSRNSPADIVYDGTGDHNTFSANGAPVTMVSPLNCG